MEDNQELYEKLKEIENKKEHTFDEQMAIECVKRLKNPFKMLTVKDIAKDLYMGENKTNEIFNRADFLSVNIVNIIRHIFEKGKYQMLCI